MNILVIEDDRSTLTSLQYCIQQLGHEVSLAANSKEAIDLITAKRFDLLISDIMMPGLSGLLLISLIRSVHRCTTPILIMSTLHNEFMLKAAYEVGANDFMAKPFSPQDLQNKLKKFN